MPWREISRFSLREILLVVVYCWCFNAEILVCLRLISQGMILEKMERNGLLRRSR
jgi:hypothetical protein